MRRSFAFRLAAAFAGVGIAAAAITALLVNLAFGHRFNDYLMQQQTARRDQLVAALAASYSRNSGWNSTDLASLSQLATMDGGTMTVLDASGGTVWSTGTDAGAGAMAQMHRGMMGGGPLGPVRTLPIRVSGGLVGSVVVQFPEPGLLPQDQAFRDSVNRLLLLGGIIAGLGALALGIILARRATAPARELTRAASALAAGDRSRRVQVETTDELGEMAQAFNRMAGTIEQEDRLRRLFATDVAHEIRTPLAILRTQIEALQDGVSEATPQSLASLHEETLRLTRLVADLEALASADAARFNLELRPTELMPLLEDAVREFAGPYEEKRVRVSTDLVEASIDADPTRVRQIVANLLSNALKFTPAGGEVGLSLRTEGEQAVIRVKDTGPGVDADELPHVFDRFFRGRGVRAAGSGVGLTVVQELALAHGGSVGVVSEPGRGATFTVRLPSSRVRPGFTAPSHPDASLGGARRDGR